MAELKQQILNFVKEKGPSLPVHIAKEINMDTLFASAFLSELVTEKRLKISHIKVGNSPLYFIHGQEPLLENFSQYLKSREKEAFLLLKENKILEDSKQNPIMRVALSEIKDFAIPFKKENNIFWRYFTIPENEILIKEDNKEEGQIENKTNIKEKNSLKEVKKKSEKTPSKKKISKKSEDKFFNKVKEFLSSKSIEIMDIEGFSKNNIILRVKNDGKESILIAYNKKRVNDSDILNAYKKASEFDLPYMILSMGNPLKKINDLLIATKNLLKIDKIE
jgi:hypothetical protein